MDISILNLNQKCYNALRNAGFNNVEEILYLEFEDLLKIKSIGIKGVKMIKSALQEFKTNTPPEMQTYLSKHSITSIDSSNDITSEKVNEINNLIAYHKKILTELYTRKRILENRLYRLQK